MMGLISHGNTTLKLAALQLIENAYRDGTIALSAISVWEIAVLVAKRKLVLNLPA